MLEITNYLWFVYRRCQKTDATRRPVRHKKSRQLSNSQLQWGKRKLIPRQPSDSHLQWGKKAKAAKRQSPEAEAKAAKWQCGKKKLKTRQPSDNQLQWGKKKLRPRKSRYSHLQWEAEAKAAKRQDETERGKREAFKMPKLKQSSDNWLQWDKKKLRPRQPSDSRLQWGKKKLRPRQPSDSQRYDWEIWKETKNRQKGELSCVDLIVMQNFYI